MKVTDIFLNPSSIGGSSIPEIFGTSGARVMNPALTLQIPATEWLGSTGKDSNEHLLQTS